MTGLLFALAQNRGNGAEAAHGTVAGERDAGSPDTGDVPASMLGAWVSETGGHAELEARVRRFTVTQGRAGGRVLTLLSVTDEHLCEYRGTLREGGSPLRIHITRTRSVPEGCAAEADLTLALEGGSVRYRSGPTDVMLTRARRDGIPERYRGTWEGAVDGPAGPGAARARVALTAGAAGAEAAQTTVPGADGRACSAMATLVSAEDEIVLYPTRPLTAGDPCEAGGMQKLVPQPDGTLRWQSATGGAGVLRRA